MRIRVPFEVAVVICIGLLIFWALFGMGHLASRLERRFSKGKIRWAVRILGFGFALPAFLIATTFYLEQDQYDAIYRGLAKFDLGEVILVTALWGGAALCWFWARWRLWSVLWALISGVAIFVKPIFWPLISTWDEPHPYGLTSETHLYFLLSGLGLFALGVILAIRWRVFLQEPSVQPVFRSPVTREDPMRQADVMLVVEGDSLPSGPALVLEPGVKFEQVHERLAALGYQRRDDDRAAEPSQAVWSREGAEVSYTFDAESGLRVLSFAHDEDAKREASRKLSWLDGTEVLRYMDSGKEDEILLGMLAGRRYNIAGYLQHLIRLRNHANPDIQAMAESFYRELAHADKIARHQKKQRKKNR